MGSPRASPGKEGFSGSAWHSQKGRTGQARGMRGRSLEAHMSLECPQGWRPEAGDRGHPGPPAQVLRAWV